jgi:hypothetical protein
MPPQASRRALPTPQGSLNVTQSEEILALLDSSHLWRGQVFAVGKYAATTNWQGDNDHDLKEAKLHARLHSQTTSKKPTDLTVLSRCPSENSLSNLFLTIAGT